MKGGDLRCNLEEVFKMEKFFQAVVILILILAGQDVTAQPSLPIPLKSKYHL